LRFGFDHEGERVGRLSARARRERFRAEAVAASGVIGNAADANYRICRLGYFTNRRLVAASSFDKSKVGHSAKDIAPP
jgi:hypothetical protein